jgi:transposase
MQTPDAIRLLVIYHNQAGDNKHEIARQCNIPRSTVIRLIQCHEITESLHASRKGRCSRHNLLSRRTSRHLAMKSRMNPSASSRAVAAAVGCDALCVRTRTVQRTIEPLWFVTISTKKTHHISHLPRSSVVSWIEFLLLNESFH